MCSLFIYFHHDPIFLQIAKWLGTAGSSIFSISCFHTLTLQFNVCLCRSLRMLALLLGLEITDASVAAIASSYSSLELLDLSG